MYEGVPGFLDEGDLGLASSRSLHPSRSLHRERGPIPKSKKRFCFGMKLDSRAIDLKSTV